VAGGIESAMASRADQLSERAAAIAASGDLVAARALLKQLVTEQPDSSENWLKLAAICRASGDRSAALDAVHRALEIAPLDFMPLMFRAVLLEALGDHEAGEAWARALARRPEGDLPGQLTTAIAQGEKTRDAWLATREIALRKATADTEAKASEEEVARIVRFRDNALRKTRVYHSEPTHFHFPGLIECEFHHRSATPWLAEVEAATDAIAAEFEAVMASERAELVPYIQYPDYEALQQWRPLNNSRDWTAIHLLQNGKLIEANARHCPQTMALLERLPQPDILGASPNAMFSLLAPETTIPPHVGISNARLVCHLPLVIPPGCWFRCGAETREWQRGQAFLFDDTIEHEAANPSSMLRVVFIFDVWHPGLSAVEREAVAQLIAAEESSAAGGL